MRAEYIEKGFFICRLRDMREDYKLVMLIAVETGLRVSDVLGLTYDTALGGQKLTERKTGKQTFVTLPEYLTVAIRSRMVEASSRGSDLVFPSGEDGKKPINRSTIYRAVKRAFADVPENVTPHTARKIYAVEAYRKDGNLRAVQDLLRHDKLETTILYAFADKLRE